MKLNRPKMLDLEIGSNSNVMPIKVLYYEGTDRYNSDDDIIEIVYKDMDTNKHYVHTIEKPNIIVYIVKPEYRHDVTFRKDYLPVHMLEPCKVRYKFRNAEIGRMLKISPKDVRSNMYVFGSDITIENAYLKYFIEEYGNDIAKQLNVGFFDIESDIIDIDGFPEYGTAPTYQITYVDARTKTSYSLFLRMPNNPLIAEFEANIDSFIDDLHKAFDESYGVLDYKIYFFDNEIDLTATFFTIINSMELDYLLAWNIPYDIQSLIERIKALGYDPTSIIPDKRFKTKIVSYEEDTNPVVHKRRHKDRVRVCYNLVDYMVVYAGIRSAKSKLPSNKLSYCAQREIGDNKLDYSESATIKTLPYQNYYLSAMYNIKDVLLMYGMILKNNDTLDLYTRCYGDALQIEEVFQSTTMLTSGLRIFFDNELGLILGNNKNKGDGATNNNKTYTAYYADEDKYETFGRSWDDDESDEEDDDEGFTGALVANPNRMLDTGYMLNGKPSTKVHDNAIDEDATSLYPSIVMILNACNETLVGKVFITGLRKMEIPLYYYKFIDNEKEKYSCDPSTFFFETLSQGQYINLGEMYFGLPKIDDILAEFEP